MDTEEQVSFGPGEGIVFAIPKRKIVRGVIGACVMCGDKESVGSMVRTLHMVVTCMLCPCLFLGFHITARDTFLKPAP